MTSFMSAFLVRKKTIVPDPFPALTSGEVWIQKGDAMSTINEKEKQF